MLTSNVIGNAVICHEAEVSGQHEGRDGIRNDGRHFSACPGDFCRSAGERIDDVTVSIASYAQQ